MMTLQPIEEMHEQNNPFKNRETVRKEVMQQVSSHAKELRRASNLEIELQASRSIGSRIKQVCVEVIS